MHISQIFRIRRCAIITFTVDATRKGSTFIALGKLEISLPQASSHTTIEPKFFEIGIDANKQFFINQKQVLKEALVAELKTLTKSDSVAISADKMATYEDFIFIIDLLKQQEIEKISMVVTKHE